jgi:hypothetical protein
VEQEALASGATTKLWPRPPLYLFAPYGGAERFTRVFRETWRKLPSWARRAMLRHWRVGPAYSFNILTPRVELLECFEGTHTRGRGGVKAAVYNRGHELKFRTRIVDAYPDHLVRDLIAHELAHVWQQATGCFETEGDDAEAQNEEAADCLMVRWGFAPYAMDEWDRAHSVTRVIDTSKMTPEQRERAEVRYWSRLATRGR